MALMKPRTAVTLRLPQLQNLIKRDPPAYEDEFLLQKRHFDSELEIFKLRATKDSDRFTELISFMSHVSVCYPQHCGAVPQAILELFETHASILHPDVRAKLLQALILMRNKGLIDPVVLIKLSFKLFGVNDKTLRTSLADYVFNDIKYINHEKRNEKLNRSVQAVLFTIVEEDVTITGKKTAQILCELYRRRIWTDARTVNMLAAACLSPSLSVTVTAVKFFLGIETKMLEDEDEEQVKTAPKPREINRHEHSKKTKKRTRLVEKQIERNAKLQRERESKDGVSTNVLPLFPAIQMIHDPYSLAEKLLKRLRQSNESFQIRLLIMNFISRLIGCHRLMLLSFYSFLQRYLTSHQQEVTHILTYLIQACHELVPPEELMPVVKAIAYNFITERCTNEVIAVGINSIREIFARIPSLLREPQMDDFVQDLAQYARKTHKSVMVAAHGLVNLVRELYPALLRRGDRGKFHDLANKPAEYGQQFVAEGVEGVELLQALEDGTIAIDEDGQVIWPEDEAAIADADSDADSAPDLMKFDNDDDDNDDDEEKEEEEEEEEEEGGSDGGADDDDDSEGGSEEEEEEEDIDNEEEDEEEEGEIAATAAATTTVQDSSSRNIAMSTAKKARQLDSVRGRLDARRVLTDEDFALLAKLKAAQSERLLDPRMRSKTRTAAGDAAVSNALKRKREEADSSDADDDDDGEGGSGGKKFAVSVEYAMEEDALLPGVRAEKSSKVERIKRMLAGRKESRFEHEGHAGGLTNKEKLRKKNYVMVRKGKREVARKSQLSNSVQRFKKNSEKEILGRNKRKRRRT